MTDETSTIEVPRNDTSGGQQPWHSRTAGAAVLVMDSDAEDGLSQSVAAERLSRYGTNSIAAEAPPSMWTVGLRQLRDPMNIMLVVVAAVSLLIGEMSTALIVGLLILLNVVLGTRQEVKAQASVDALATMQIPETTVVRGGAYAIIPAVEVVPGDIVHLEAGDLVPADGRILHAVTLETQEAALTGESAPVAKGIATLPTGDVALGDRSNMLFQNT
jgi:Ca2+-transporting ATPase